MRQVAIVGSGPAGCYAAEHLLRVAPDAAIDVIERLPTPFGLIRAGVAPDHQATKAVARVLDRVLARDRVALLGGVALGRDVSLAALCDLYDAVVLATGAPLDRRLGVPGEDLPGVWGSAAFVGWYNSHPDAASSAPDLSAVRRVVVIGAGNVALDVARLLAKTPDERAQSDLDPAVEAALAAAPLTDVHLVARRDAAAMRFTVPELAELGRLARARPVVETDALDGDGPVLAQLRDWRAAPADERPLRIHLHAGLRPEAIEGDGRVRAVRFAGPAGPVTLPADLVVTCIGYAAPGCGDLAPVDGRLPNQDGRIADRLWTVGWAKRGPSGTIPTNRAEAHAVMARLVAETRDGGRAGRAGLLALLASRGVEPVDHAGWQRIDAAERAAAAPGRPRFKLATHAALRAAAQAARS